MKRMMILILMAVLMIVLLPSACAQADETEYTSGAYTYKMLQDGTVCITKYAGEDNDLVIPDVMDGMKVTSIGKDAFYWRSSLTSITIPGSVTSIGDKAFDSCSSLTSITIPDSVEYMGANPFVYCKKLAAINVSPKHPVFATIDGVLFNKKTKCLIWYPMTLSQTRYSIPQGIKEIGE